MSRRRNKLIALGLVHLGHKFIFRTAELLGERCRKPPFEGQVLTRCGIRTKVQEQCRGAGRKWKRIPHAASNGGEGTAVGAGTDVTRLESMARKRTGQGPPGKGSPGQLKSRIRTPIVTRSKTTRNLSERSQSPLAKAFHVMSDARRDPNLTVTRAAKNREISIRSLRKYIGSQLIQEHHGGRIRVSKSDRLRATLNIPSTKPDVLIPIRTKSSRERYLIGEWQASLNGARGGDFGRMNRFPKGTVIGGVLLPTDPQEVQQILEAMESSETPFERLYAVAGAS